MIRRLGKKGLKWIQDRNAWFEAHPASQYKCHYCRKWMDRRNTTLDHVNGRNQDNANRDENLVTCCLICNTRKGSIKHDRYVKLHHRNHNLVCEIGRDN